MCQDVRVGSRVGVKVARVQPTTLQCFHMGRGESEREGGPGPISHKAAHVDMQFGKYPLKEAFFEWGLCSEIVCFLLDLKH